MNGSRVDHQILRDWATIKFSDSLLKCEGPDLVLFAKNKQEEEKSSKSFKLVLRNFAQAIKSDMGQMTVELLTEQEFEDAMGTARNSPPSPRPAGRLEVVDSLPDDFAEASRRLFEKLQRRTSVESQA